MASRRRPIYCASCQRETNPGTLIDHQNAFGRTEKGVRGNQKQQQIARIQLSCDTAFTVTIEALNPVGLNAGETEGPALTPWVTLKWGNGNVLHESTIDATWTAQVPLCASTVEVNVWLGDADKVPAPASGGLAEQTVTYRVSIAEGILGLPQRNTSYFPANVTDGEQLVVAHGGRIASVRGYNYGTDARVLMGFDARTLASVVNGAVPLIAVPAPPIDTTLGPRSYSDEWLNGVAFKRGLVWKVSSTEDTLTYDAAATLRIETELFNI